MGPSPLAVVHRLRDALNAHDLDSFVGCFADDYESVQPLHPAAAFRGAEQVRRNWAAMFAGVPDLRGELLGAAVDGVTVWSEWRMAGTRTDGGPLELAGVIVMDVRDERIASARLYLEEVEPAGVDVEALVRGRTGRPPS